MLAVAVVQSCGMPCCAAVDEVRYMMAGIYLGIVFAVGVSKQPA